MADRKQKPVWVRSFHPADTEKNLEMLYESLEVLLPDYPVITKDLDDAVVVDDGAHTFDITVADVARGTLSYQWQKKTTGDFENVSGGTNADLEIASWDNTGDAGIYRCKVINTLNGATAITYTNECTATTLMPDPIVITKDLPDTVEVEASTAYTFDLNVAAVTIGTLAYQWEKKTTGEFESIALATAADYTVASWDDTANAGTYRCKITNTLNNDVITVYSNECVATTAVGG
jgi:hypothetical protein